MAPRGTLPYAAGNVATYSFQGFVFVFELVYFATAYTELAAICECEEEHVSCYWLADIPSLMVFCFCFYRLVDDTARMDKE